MRSLPLFRNSSEYPAADGSRRVPACLFLAALLALAAGCGDRDSATGPVDDGGEPDGDDPAYSHSRTPGASARDFLSDETFTRLAVEVDWVEGFRPDPAAVDSLEVFLGRRLHKPGGVEIVLDDSIPSPGQSPYQADDVRALEETHRDTYTRGDTLAAYVVFLDGSYEQESVLGIAYYNTSMAIFEEVIRDHSGGPTQPPTPVIEATTLRHETGHVLGLVASGTPMVGEEGGSGDHHDEDNGAHCTEQGTLMYYRVETTDFIQNLQGGEVPPLDTLGIEDLRANGGK